jgi:hypothetical protein
MKAYGGVDVQSHVSLTSALVGGEWSASRPGLFTLGERAPSTHWIRGWAGPRIGPDYVKRRKFLPLPGLELRPLGRPARSQSLYRLSYPGFMILNKRYLNVHCLVQRCTSRAHRTVCEDVCSSACTRAKDATARPGM